MSRHTETHLVSAVLCACMALAPASATHAQTIGDYSRSHRATLEAEMARNTAKVLGSATNTSAAATPTPPAPTPPAPPLPAMPMGGMPAGAPPDIAVAGVIILSRQAMVELNLSGEKFLLLAGDKVPGTAWVVGSVRSDHVVLTSGSKRRTLAVNTGGR